GDEKITIVGERRNDKGNQVYWNKTVSWNEIMKAIAPLILWESKSEDYIMRTLAERISGYPKSYPTIRLQERERIKYQLRELGLVSYKKARATDGTNAWFWEL